MHPGADVFQRRHLFSSSSRHRRSRLGSLLLVGVVGVLIGGVSIHRFSSQFRLQRHALVATPLARPSTEVSNNEGGGDDACQALLATTLSNVKPSLSSWEKLTRQGRLIRSFGRKAEELVEKTLSKFDEEVHAADLPEDCAAERKAAEDHLHQQMLVIFSAQSSIVEQNLYQRLRKDLLRRMRWKKRELDVNEKLRLLHASLTAYDSQVQQLQPAFILDSEHARAEKHLSELQWGIGNSPEAKDMKQRWKTEQMRRPSVRSRGISVSLSPGLRLMFRPKGLGNLQLLTQRQVGPSHNPNEISIGVLNDGTFSDVYNKEAHPPIVKFQPTVGFEMRIR